jgi:hypothetical protein
MRIFFSNGVRHHHEQSVANLAIRLPALLPVFNAVLQEDEERIAKNFVGILKADAVLALVGEVLCLAPRAIAFGICVAPEMILTLSR